MRQSRRKKKILETTLALALCGGPLPLLWEQVAHAQVQPGQIQGTVVNQETGKPLAGVTVVISGPALQGEQTEFTDAGGRYLITQLPSGDNYIVRFYFNDVIVERPGVRVAQGKTLTIGLSMPTQKGDKKIHVIRERAPNVDTASANQGVEVSQEILQNTAVRGRSFESVIALAPGAADVAPSDRNGIAGGDVGVSVSGGTGNENNFLVDGLNTTDPNLGILSAQIHQYFLKEVNVITGGYQAEYGRATGGIISVVTKTGSNEFHGGVFGSWAPFQLEPRTVARLGEALGIRRKIAQEYDFGFELGGPLYRDRIWFYIGFVPTFTNWTVDRAVRTQSFDPRTGRAQLDSEFSCPSYLAYEGYCEGPRLLALRTTELSERTQTLFESRRRYNWIAKLQFNLNPDHNIQLGYVGSPETFDGYAAYRQDLRANRISQTQQIHDVTARYVGKLLERKLQLELMYGLHYQSLEDTPEAIDSQSIFYRTSPTNPYSLADFEQVAECRRSMQMGPNGPVSFNPCPITDYQTGGYDFYNRLYLQRHVVLASATYFTRLLGNHAFKLGFDFEDNLADNFRTYTGTDLDPSDPFAGHRRYRTSADGQRLQIHREFAVRTNTGGTMLQNGFRGITETRNFAAYLRDNWVVSFVPGLVLNLGVRWEGQEIYGQDGSKQIAIYDNWAPRVGAVYDFTRKGRSKLYVNYGRFYESIPLDMNDRQFSGEGLASTGYTANCPKRALQPGGREVPVAAAAPGAPCSFPAYGLNGGGYGEVAPNLKGQFINEVVGGFQYDVGLDIVLGVSYTYRNYGNIIEDMSTDGGNFYIIGNPGQAADPEVVSRLSEEAERLQQQSAANPADAELANKAGLAKSRLDSYKAVGTVFPKPVRNYHAVTVTANKRLSNRFSLLANYTYSRTIGNYPGTFQSTTGQNDPNISSQYDLSDLLANTYGPLPTDRPHNFKLTGYYVQPIGQKGSLTAGLTFSAFSGRPINVLGFHIAYGQNEVFILPRGAGGRTPLVTQFDLHVGYEHQMSKNTRISLFADAINLFNQREVVNVDDEYTASPVQPIVAGRPEDLARLRAADGTAVVPNSNYGQPTAFQAPLYMRFGARLSF